MSDRKATTVPGDRWENLEAFGRAVRVNRPPAGPRVPGPGRPRHRRLRRTLVIGLVAVLVVALGGLFLGWRYVSHVVSQGAQAVHNLVPSGAGKATNFLVVGSDSRGGLSREELSQAATRPVDGGRTDTIILVHVSPGQKKAVMVSIPRDLKVNIPGHGQDKINAAYAFGGPDLLVKTIADNLGVPVNHYAEVDFAGFLKVVDALGGVRLCNDTGRRLDDSYANLHMPPGCHNMDGVQALAFVRARHIDSDFGRIGRQQQFLRAVMSKVSAKGNLLNLPKLMSIANMVSAHVKTDDTLKTGEAISLVRRIGKLDSESVDMRLYPSFDAGIDPSNGVDYVHAAPEAPILMKAIADDAAQLPPVGLPQGKGVSLRDIRLAVLNGGGTPGAAARASDGLRRYGLRVVQTGNASRPTGAHSTLAYPPALEQQAKLLSYLLGKQVELVRAGGGASSTLVLTVGSSYQVVAAAAG
ncbi:MAG TPA: LCP family protein [Actinomycetes bacterium]|nr:LCP family protein [Actinomycetes bacterium]